MEDRDRFKEFLLISRCFNKKIEITRTGSLRIHLSDHINSCYSLCLITEIKEMRFTYYSLMR